MAAVRPLPQQSIIECIPPASEIADLRILNKDLNFIQAMTKRAEDLNSQALSATENSQLVKITDSFGKKRFVRMLTKTLKELANESNPLTEVNSSAELLEKVQILSKTLESKTQELSGLYNSNENSLLDSYGASISELTSQVDSITSPDAIISLFPQIESLLKDVEENVRYISNSSESATINRKNCRNLQVDYSDKAEQYS